MILEKQTENLVISDGDSVDTIKSKLDIESADFLMRMMTKGFYADGIGSTVRETVSNAIDSVRKTGNNEPVIVDLKRTPQGNYEYSVQDYGLGLDHDTVINVISLYGKSTKRGDSSQIGAMGLGWKAPLSYTSSFQFIAVKDGIKRKYIQSEGEEGGSTIDLLDESPTEDRNGVKVIVPVNYNDYREFIDKQKEQLAYFQGVYFQGGLGNDFNIYRSEHFQWSSMCEDQNLHICLDDVYYPIDWAKLGVSAIRVPVGLRFSLTDGIYPLPNRESIKYTKESKDIILKKIALVAEYFVEKFNTKITEKQDVFEIANYYRYSERYVDALHEKGNKLRIDDLLKYSKIKIAEPKIEGVELLNLKDVFIKKDHLVGEYSRKYEYYSGRFSNMDKATWKKSFGWNKAENKRTYIISDILPKKKQDYLRSIWDYNTRDIVKKEKSFKLGNAPSTRYNQSGFGYWKLLELYNHPKSQWRQRIREWQLIQKLVTDTFIDLDKLEIPQEWLDEQKSLRLSQKEVVLAESKRRKTVGEVVGKLACSLERYVSGKECKFESTNFKLDEAYKQPYFTIYTTHDNEDKIQKYYTIVSKKKVRFVTFSGREIKLLKDVKIHNWMNMDEFEKGEHIIFKRIVTAYLINNLINEQIHCFSRIGTIENVSSDLADKLHKLESYKNDHFLNGSGDIYKAMLEVAESKNLFDTSIYDIYKEVKNVLEKLKFLNNILEHCPRYYEERKGYTDAICDLFKYYKHRVNWGNYNLPINEEVKEEITINELENELI